MTEQRGDKVIEGDTRPRAAVRGGISQLWLALPCCIMALWAGALLGRSAPSFQWEILPLLAAAIATAVFALILNKRLLRPEAGPEAVPIGESLRELLDSAGPGVVATDLNGALIYCNPSAERMMGYRAAELLALWNTGELLTRGESERLLTEMQKLCHVTQALPPTPGERIRAYVECVRSLPPSMVPSFDAQLRRSDGAIVPVALHISALRDSTGELTGMVAVGVDQSAVLSRDQTHRESQERYRDLFENSSEMIATLSPAGQFLYANPAWKRSFGLDYAALMSLHSFEDLFSSDAQSEAAALFRRALDGEPVERAPLRHHTADGRVLELEVSLSRRQKTGIPMAVRCLLRDVTQQKQRENRLALQLAVSQIMGENSWGDSAGMRILDALCISQGWDVAIQWMVDSDDQHLEFATAWGIPGGTLRR